MTSRNAIEELAVIYHRHRSHAPVLVLDFCDRYVTFTALDPNTKTPIGSHKRMSLTRFFIRHGA